MAGLRATSRLGGRNDGHAGIGDGIETSEDVPLINRPTITTINMADATTEIDLDSVIDRLLEGE